MKKIIWTSFIALLVLTPLRAQEDELPPVTGTIAITNVNIVPSPGQLIQNGTVVVKNGVITAVGDNVQVPVGARTIKGDSMYLYSGFILGMSHVGVKMPQQEGRQGRPDVDDPGNPPNELAGITPERSVTQYLDPEEKSISEWRNLGFALAQTAPEGGMLPGTASVILLKGNSVGDVVFVPGTSLYATFDGARRIYPSNILGVMAKYRELYRQAEQAQTFSQTYLRDPSGRERPRYSKTLEAFYPVLEEQIPVIFKAEEVLEAQRAMLLQEELGFDLVVAELKQGWDIANDIDNSDARVLFSLDLPEWKEEKEDTTQQETASSERQMLESRRKEFIQKYYGQMGQYAAADIPFGFSGLEGKPGDFHKNIRKMVENGLSEEAALAALTTTPASILGVSNMTGTVENGKMANLVISTKPYFNEDARVRYVMVEGVLFEQEQKVTKKADPEEVAQVTGTWTYTADTPDGPITGRMVLEENNGLLEGTITNNLTGEVSILEELVLAEDRLTFNFDVIIQGETANVLAVLDFSGDSFEGTLTGAGQEFSIQGAKSPN